MKKVIHKIFCVAALALPASTGTAQAQIVAASSDFNKVVVGTSNWTFGPHVAGLPGIAVRSIGLDVVVDFKGLQDQIGVDGAGISTINEATTVPSDHGRLGTFHFAKVGSANLYFGEWSQTASVADGTHTVYYAGDTAGTTMPATGSATYSVTGISDYANKGPMTGTFTANYGSGISGTLTGSLSNATGYSVNIGTNYLVGPNFAGAGPIATQSGSTVAYGGLVMGRFYGSNAAALAGYVRFYSSSMRPYDTAFGGTKN